MHDQLSFLVRRDELEFKKRSFRGKQAGMLYKYSNHLDGLIRTRAIIFAMVVIVVVPAVLAMQEETAVAILQERLVLSAIFLLAGLLFNKLRYLSIVIAALPLLLILVSYFFTPGAVGLRPFAFNGAVLALILSGIRHNYLAKKLRKELTDSSPENLLTD